MRPLLALLLIGCSTEGTIEFDPDDTGVAADTGEPADTSEPDDTGGACGEVTVWDLRLVGRVVDADGAGLAGAAVQLEDRGWDPGDILGTDVTDATGAFDMGITDLTSVEDCWGVLLDYVLMGSTASLAGERGVNHILHRAITDGSLEADTTEVPLVLD